MAELQTIETVPEEEKAKETFVSASEIRVHPSGKYVYAANRGHDTITAMRVEPDSGKLTVIEDENGQLVFSKSSLDILRQARQ